MLIVVERFVMASNRPNRVHKVLLQALQRHLGTGNGGSAAKVSYRNAVEMTQGTLTDLRPHKLSTVHDVCDSTESAVVISYHLHDANERPGGTFGQG